MQTILEYIMLNYTWILAGSIIILLAVIGYYADKTNFGQGKTKETDNRDNFNMDSLEGKRLDDLFEDKDGDDVSSNEILENTNVTNNKANVQTDNSKNVTNAKVNVQTDNSKIETIDKLEENFDKFDKEFNELLPKKEIIDDELLDEINNLSLDKTQRIQLTDIPDVDDVDLPEIKSLQIEEEDIWKF